MGALARIPAWKTSKIEKRLIWRIYLELLGECMRVVLLDPTIEGSFFKFLRRDIISNYFALLDLKFYRDRTKFWIALGNDEVLGYLLEHDGRIINLRGNGEVAAKLLSMASLSEVDFNIELEHFQTVKRFYEPTRPIGVSRGEVTTLLAMEADKGRFRPIIEHEPKKLGADEFDDIEKLYVKFCDEMGTGPITRERIMGMLDRCLTYGIYEGNELISFANGSTLEDVGYIAPVYTLPKFRGKGNATSSCSALVRELLGQKDRTILFVPEDNVPALRVYEKIGFTKTGHKFLAFWGRKIA
jgi:GNAT superfamily N-acetyltransferase